MPVLSSGFGQYVAGEKHLAISDRLYRGGEAVVSVPWTDWLYPWVGRDLAYALAKRGYQWISGEIGQAPGAGLFGNDTARDRVGSLRDYAQSAFGAAAGAVHLMGISNGAAAAINYARANPANVRSIIGLNPLTDIEALHDLPVETLASIGVTRAQIENAWGGAAAFETAMPTGNPQRAGNQAVLSAIPMLLLYSEDDIYTVPSITLAYAGLVNGAGGQATTYSLGSVGHAFTGLRPQVVLDFIEAL